MLRQPKSWAAAAVLAAGAAVAIAAVAAAQDVPALVRLDVSAVDKDGRPVADLSASQFTVTVDGAPRRVVSARFVHRGPGAEAAARAAAAGPTGAALFEPVRTLLVVVDESSFPRGAEKAATTAVDRLLDRFGPSDQVALVRIPASAGPIAVSFHTDRRDIRDALAMVRGRGETADLTARADLVSPIAAAPPAADTGASGSVGDRPPSGSADVARPVDAGGDASADAADLREHPLQSLARLLAGLRVAPGPKTVVVISAGLSESAAWTGSRLRALQQAVEGEAVAARAAVYVLGVQAAGHLGSWSELEQLCAATGGDLVRVGRNLDQALDRTGQAVSGFYQVEIEPAATDRDARGRAVKVAVARPGVAARAARQIALRTDPPFLEPHLVAPPPAEAAAYSSSSAPPRPSAKGRAAVREVDHDLDALLARAREYLGGYFREFRNVVAEEEYTQTNLSTRPAEVRRTKADFLLVMDPDGRNLVPFRDVFEVDGRAVRDREDRLKKLFLDPSPSGGIDGATRVQMEGARYNFATRNTVNVPTYPLGFLLDDLAPGFRFRRGREDTVDGVRAVRVDYEEQARPTVIRTPAGKDVVSAGSFWIDPLTGRVVKTYLSAARVPGTDDQATLTMEATVTYRRSDALGLWVPAEMRETYRLRGSQIDGRALYSNFRSFQVRTEQEIKAK